MTSKRKT
jgi:hypothetical protein